MKRLPFFITTLLASAMLTSACGGKNGQSVSSEAASAAQTTAAPQTESAKETAAEKETATAQESDSEQSDAHQTDSQLSAQNLDDSAPTLTLPVSEEELAAALRSAQDGTVITVLPGSGSLEISSFVSVSSGTALVLEEGASLSVQKGGTLNVEGSMEVKSDMTNDGSLILMEGGRLEVTGSFVNSGLLSNGDLDKETPEGETQDCQIVAAGGISNTGVLINTGHIEGTVANDGGNITLMGGVVDNITGNGGQIIECGGQYGAGSD